MIGGAPDDIHLDTSFLIRALASGSAEAAALRSWLGDGRAIAISTLVWGELLCGPLEGTSERLARRIVPAHVPLGTDEAAGAADLFHGTGRRRGSFQDCIVAATAMGSGAALATSDVDDFGRFVSRGLKLTS